MNFFRAALASLLLIINWARKKKVTLPIGRTERGMVYLNQFSFKLSRSQHEHAGSVPGETELFMSDGKSSVFSGDGATSVRSVSSSTSDVSDDIVVTEKSEALGPTPERSLASAKWSTSTTSHSYSKLLWKINKFKSEEVEKQSQIIQQSHNKLCDSGSENTTKHGFRKTNVKPKITKDGTPLEFLFVDCTPTSEVAEPTKKKRGRRRKSSRRDETKPEGVDEDGDVLTETSLTSTDDDKSQSRVSRLFRGRTVKKQPEPEQPAEQAALSGSSQPYFRAGAFKRLYTRKWTAPQSATSPSSSRDFYPQTPSDERTASPESLMLTPILSTSSSIEPRNRSNSAASIVAYNRLVCTPIDEDEDVEVCSVSTSNTKKAKALRRSNSIVSVNSSSSITQYPPASPAVARGRLRSTSSLGRYRGSPMAPTTPGFGSSTNMSTTSMSTPTMTTATTVSTSTASSVAQTSPAQSCPGSGSGSGPGPVPQTHQQFQQQVQQQFQQFQPRQYPQQKQPQTQYQEFSPMPTPTPGVFEMPYGPTEVRLQSDDDIDQLLKEAFDPSEQQDYHVTDENFDLLAYFNGD